MSKSSQVPSDCIIPLSALVHPDAIIANRVVLAGADIVVGPRARLDAASVIGENVTIGQGAWVRAGAVVLTSVPPNAIVEGNPAQVVGYCREALDTRSQLSKPRQVDIHEFSENVRPSQVGLGVGGSALYLMRKMTDVRGSLTVGDVPAEVPFSPKRYFAVFDVPSAELRGEHAHKRCQQFLICLHGSCRVLLDDGAQSCEVTLDRPDMGVFMPEMIWGTQYRYSTDAVLLVFASRHYEAEDYLRNYDDFLTELKRQKA